MLTESEARREVAGFVSRGTSDRLEMLVAYVRSEQQHQNLVSPSTLEHMWSRHVLDSVQLCRLIERGPLIDIGSGAGFPGLVMALLVPDEVHLVEPRRRRAEFLRLTAERLGAKNVQVHGLRVEMLRLTGIATITARAVASLSKLFDMAIHLVGPDCQLLLQKGRTAEEEIAEARRKWSFHVERRPSMTAADSVILQISRLSRG